MTVCILFLFTILAFSLPAQENAAPEPPAAPPVPAVPGTPVKKEAPLLVKAGTVVSAVVLEEKPAISNPYGNQKNNSSCWVEVMVKPDAGRSVSIHDYVLVADGSEYPSVAVALDGDTYSGEIWKLEQLDGSKNFKLLFPVPSRDYAYRIQFKLFPTSLPPAKLELPVPASDNSQSATPENP